jgi:hypothetical protein
MSKEDAAQLGEGKDALDAAAGHGIEKSRTVTEGSSMTVFHPARWKNVASSQPLTNSSQREKSPGCSSLTCTASGDSALADVPDVASSLASSVIDRFEQ